MTNQTPKSPPTEVLSRSPTVDRTELAQRAEGDARSARAEATKPKRKNYKKAAAAHFKALLGMNDGKFFTPKQRGAIVEAAGICGIEIA